MCRRRRSVTHGAPGDLRAADLGQGYQLVEVLDDGGREATGSLGPFVAADGEVVVEPGQAVERIAEPAKSPGPAGVRKLPISRPVTTRYVRMAHPW
jgi:hypothetical protein